jgi:hypothetical protein
VSPETGAVQYGFPWIPQLGDVSALDRKPQQPPATDMPPPCAGMSHDAGQLMLPSGQLHTIVAELHVYVGGNVKTAGLGGVPISNSHVADERRLDTMGVELTQTSG